MPRVKLHNNQLTLPAELRRALSTAADDELDAELVAEGVLLKTAVKADRKKAWDQVFEAMESVKYIGPEPEPGEDAVMEMVVEEIHAMRQENEAKKGRSR